MIGDSLLPQETKSHVSLSPADDQTARLGEQENLEGWIPPLVSPEQLIAALEKAFGYRGDVCIHTRQGQVIEGYVFDRGGDGVDLQNRYVRLYPKGSTEKIRIAYSDIARLEFSGKDAAAGKSFQTWLKKYQEKKAAGESNIRIDPEEL